MSEGRVSHGKGLVQPTQHRALCRAPAGTEQAAAGLEHPGVGVLDATPLPPQPAGTSGTFGQEVLPVHGQDGACRAVPRPSGLREPLRRAEREEEEIKHTAIDLFLLF